MGRKQWKTIKKEREERKREKDQKRLEQKAEYKDYLMSDRWKLLKNFAHYRVKEEHGKLICEQCGKPKPRYEVHHYKYPHDLLDDSPNLHELLCVRCHKIRHDLLKKEEMTKEEIEQKEKEDSGEYLKEMIYEQILEKKEGSKEQKSLLDMFGLKLEEVKSGC